jgi:regulator of protease activity HflC (stomatin/prohibitin superfamily)
VKELEIQQKRLAIFVGFLIIVIVIVALLVASIEVVPAGYKGVIVNSPDGPSEEEIPEGWNVRAKYIFADIEHVEWRTQKMSFVGADTAGDNVGSIVVSSKDNIQVTMDFSVIYHIEPDKVSELIIDNGMDYQSRIINPIARSEPRNIGAKYLAIEIRGEMRDEVEKAIAENIARELAKKHIIVERFTLQDIRLPAKLEEAIEQKKVAEQNVLTQQYNLAAEQYVANKTIVRMEATAAAIVINATAAANATVIRAHGQAEAIGIIMEYLNSTADNETREYLQWVYLQALTDPNTSIQYVIIPSEGGVPVLLEVQQQ